MKAFWRVVRYTRPFRGLIGLNILFNLLASVFALATIGLVIPVLRIIFNKETGTTEAPEFEGNFFGYAEDKLMYEIGIRMQATGQDQALLYVCAIVIVAFFLKNLFRYLALYAIAPMRNGVTRDIRRDLHAHILRLPVGYFTEQRKGDVISRMTADLKEIENSILTTVELIFRDPVMIIASLVVLILMSPQLTLFVFILLPVVSILITGIGKSLKKSSREAQHKVGEVLSQTEEDLAGLKVIKAFNAEAVKHKRFRGITAQYFRLMNRVLRKNDLASPISEFLGAIVMAIVIWYGGSLVLAEGGFTAEEFIAYVLFFYQIIPPAKNLSKASYKIQRGNASAERVLEILDAENPIKDKADAQPIDEFKETLRFEQVGFAYADKPVLKNIALDIPKGSTIALVGQSGGGKSTLTQLVPRFYDVKSGKITIDGTDIRDYHLEDLRSLLGIVTQETLLFNDSVAENIALGQPDASREGVIEAAKIANAHEFIEKLEQGYDTNIGDGGGKLSGGQRQRLSIARAVLKNPPILILDEATSALDTESEKLVQEALYKLMENRTSLVVAHRLSTIQHADQIVVMHDGEIAEQGTHDELLERGGVYQKLVQMQSFS